MESDESLFSAEIQLEEPGGLKVTHVAGEDAQAANESGSGDKSIFAALDHPGVFFQWMGQQIRCVSRGVERIQALGGGDLEEVSHGSPGR